MTYHTSLLEDWIEQLYQQIGIYHPEQLDYQTIAKKLNIKLKFRAISSRLYKDVILIDDRLTPEQQFEEFSHEVCHKLRHAGNHIVMPDMFLELQEFQANHFSLHFCVPTFMLKI
ncbi:ImmA/IrrE family metallo-endopeptidase [Priestia megaterium]